MIQILVKGGLLCSCFVCDVCQKPIKHVGGALVAIPDCFDPSRRKGEALEVAHVHKGACQRSYEAECGRWYGDLELRDHIAQLLVNACWNRKEWSTAMASWGNQFAERKAGREPEDT